jgi:prepilin-type N-terminal cleavage/methylation domain-containing protein
MQVETKRAGFSVIEMVVVLAIVAVLALTASFGTREYFARQRLKSATRDIANLVHTARTEAIRTGTRHVLCFAADPAGAPLTHPEDGLALTAVVARDDSPADGIPDANEYVASARLPQGASIGWGVSSASVPAPGDPTPDTANPPPSPWTFLYASTPTQWLAFEPDGIPRAYVSGPFTEGNAATGAGAVYLTDGRLDYALVVTPLGAVSAHAWGGGTWTR